MNQIRAEKKYKIYLIIAIPFLFYAFFVLVPLIIGIYNSFFNWKGGPTKTFIGFGNYVRMFKDRHWHQAVRNNFQAMLVALIGMTGFGYIFALLLNTKFMGKTRKVYRFIIFLPVILSGVVVGYIFSMILNQNPGLLNIMLEKLGLESLQQVWLGDKKIAMWSVSFIMVWQGIGMHVVIYLASLQNIPQDVLDASLIDGCTGIKQAVYVITPMMKGTIVVSITLSITSAMKMFEYIYITTKGSPGGATYVMTYYTYQTAFEKLMYLGYSCALVVTSILICVALVAVVKRVLGGQRVKF